MSSSPVPSPITESGRGRSDRRAAFRQALKLMLVVYAATFGVFVVSSVVLDDLTTAMIFKFGLAMLVVDGALALLLFPAVWASESAPPMPRLLILAAAVLMVTILQTAWDTTLRVATDTIADRYGSVVNAAVRAFVLNLYHNGLFAALLAQQGANRRILARERDAADARVAEQAAHLAALRFQLNPHFLFNAMNALSSLVVLRRNDEAEAMIEKLTDFLRGSLFADPESTVRLDDEFAMLDAYLAIERTRFGDRLIVDLSLAPSLGGAIVPSLLLQPLVENAVKYAVAPSRRPVAVRIAAEQDGEELVLSVIDDGDAQPVAGGTGIGLENIRQRLAIAHGDRAELTTAKGETGFTATVRLPLAY